jgi:hypothetical protein
LRGSRVAQSCVAGRRRGGKELSAEDEQENVRKADGKASGKRAKEKEAAKAYGRECGNDGVPSQA